MSEPLLRIRNHHAPGCGDPPIVNGNDPALYVGYFENEHGEQWVFTYHRQMKVAELRGGDIGWNRAQSVVGGQVPGLVLSAGEAAWLQACWQAASRAVNPRLGMPGWCRLAWGCCGPTTLRGIGQKASKSGTVSPQVRQSH